jgi:multiple sugar transport system permease protein
MSQRGGGWSGWLWTAPWWLGFLFFLVTPMATSLYISFCDYSLLQPAVWVGGENYAELAADPVFWKAIRSNLLFAALSIPLTTAVAIGLAILLNQPVRGQAFFRAVVFLPTIVPLVAVGLIWMWLLNPDFGLLNQLLRSIGIAEPPIWLERPASALAALLMISVWGVGATVFIYLAGLQEIPQALYEAAALDGASAIARFRHVTLPGLGPVILFNVVLGIINAWQLFALPYVMWRTAPRPELGVYYYNLYLFDNAFRYLRMGYASAMAWIQLGIVLLLTAIVFWVSRRSVHYRGA